jgi:hypothetical protein
MGYLFAVIVSVIGEVMVGFQRFAVFSVMSETERCRGMAMLNLERRSS